MSLAKRNSEAAAKWAAKRRESQERALLQERSLSSSISRRRTPACRETQPPPRNAASTSHEANAAYMEDFRKGMADMYLALEGPGGTKADLGASAAVGCSNTRTTALLGNLPSQYGKSPQERISHREPQGRAGRFGGSAVKGGFLGSKLKEGCTTGGGVAVASGWRQGPLDAAGQLLDLSDRNLLCLSVRGDEAVFGSADHSLYCVDLSRGITTRQLYGSRSKPDAGHTEWVSVVCHTAQGDIASGGVDGKLCLWPRGGGGGGGGRNPGEVQAHAGSISAMKADEEGRVATSGYGGAVRVWDCRRSGGRGGAPPRLSGELSDGGLPAPCMDFSWSSDGRRAVVMTGHRDGRVGFFDAETGAIVAGGCKGGAHRGHVTVVEALDNMMGVSGCCFATGGQDGFVRIWDPRTGAMEGGGSTSVGAGPAAVMEAPAHRGPEGVGAVGGLMVARSGGNRLASFGADRRVCVLEVRGGRSGGGDDVRRHREQSSSLAIEHVFDEHRDFIYCMDFVPVGSGAARAGSGGDVLVTGGGDGMLLVHDLDSMRLLYGLGCCSTGAVRCAVARENMLTVAGDDGNAMLYSFGGDTAEEVGGRTPGRRK
ncbi:conserved unknown protein [Ectocarpus siliculosus]|uniref:Uncharacterized protein n=1 Tax=Ectocarpus siliculosus TaxID=2880 RepID=D7G2S1_ECTSI|nr:conserved unknown protein [Ectocarpus siliculosus]|eukprot:CBJ26896.1 conserved unknown protein [Ectocarpus siliculosus]